MPKKQIFGILIFAIVFVILLSGCPEPDDGNGDVAPGCKGGGLVPTGCLGKHIIKDIEVAPSIDCLEVSANNCNDGILEIDNDCGKDLILEGKHIGDGGALDIAWINGDLVPVDAIGNFSFFLPSEDRKVTLKGTLGEQNIEVSFTKTAALCGGNLAEEIADQIFEKVKAANHCETASDCMAEQFHCPTVCYSYINLDADVDEIFDLRQQYLDAGGKCPGSLALCTEPELFDCVQGKCVEKVLSELEQEVFETYYEYLEGKTAEGTEYHCSSDPEIEGVDIINLNPKLNLNSLDAFCLEIGCYGPACAMPAFFFYESEAGELVMFEESKLEEHFSELFQPLENSDELTEYLTLTGTLELGLLDDALAEWDLTQEDCNFLVEIPDVNKVITQDENGFAYHGFSIMPVGTMELRYHNYHITNNGEITKLIEDEIIAECGEGIVY